ncbi:MAG: arsenate reductase ArsC [Hyphomicrobiales bacterium]|nr:arsenate reductase ArsC [Hyphomicrobiales bacterium]MCY4048288.1 arsenate reductase ArsC [Hyphomicrobiales bacterium]MCY4053837.1 arsenate reductase ArsC [Hyphomicrobiales bacterium]
MGKNLQLPDAVLFACNQNSIRSPMAEAILKHILGDKIYVDSCGLVASEIDPFVLAVMDEINIDLSKHKAKSFDNLADTSFNLIIALTPESLECANEFTRAISVAVEYWPTSNPSDTIGSREHKLEAYRRVRDDLIKQIQKRFEIHSKILPDSTKHVKRKP